MAPDPPMTSDPPMTTDPQPIASDPSPMAMEFAEVVRRRRTIRNYDPARAVDPDVVEQIVRIGLQTPSAGNSCAVTLSVLTGGVVEAFWQLTAADADNAWLRGMRGAPVLVLVWTDRDGYLPRYGEPSAPWWWVDAGMVVQNLVLAATAAGLDSAFVGIPPEAQEAVALSYGRVGAQSVGVVALGNRPVDHRPRPPRRMSRPVADRIRRYDS